LERFLKRAKTDGRPKPSEAHNYSEYYVNHNEPKVGLGLLYWIDGRMFIGQILRV